MKDPDSYASDTDTMVLEDENMRIKLIGKVSSILPMFEVSIRIRIKSAISKSLCPEPTYGGAKLFIFMKY